MQEKANVKEDSKGTFKKLAIDDVKKIQSLVEEAIKKEGINFVVLSVATKFSAIKPEFTVSGVQRLVATIFPKTKLANGSSPEELAKEYISTNRYFRNDFLYLKARQYMEEHPSATYSEVAKAVNIPYMTLISRLRGDGVPKLTRAEKGRHNLTGRGIPIETKKEYSQYLGRETFEKLRIIIQKNGFDLKKSEAEWALITGNKSRAGYLFRDIFPAYLVEKDGVERCIENYSAWIDTNPKGVINRPQSEKERYKEYLEENRAWRNKQSNILKFKRKALSIISRLISDKVELDATIENKELFSKIAAEILSGENGILLSRKYAISELAVIGVRGKMIQYLSEYDPYALKNRKLIQSLLSATKFYDTVKEEWVSPEYHNYVKYREIQKVLSGDRVVTENLEQKTKTATEESFKKENLAEKKKRFLVNRDLHRHRY